MPPRTTPPTPAPELSIPVHDLDASGRDFDLPLRAAWLRGVLEGTDVGAPSGDGALHVRLSKSGNDVVVRGSLAAQVLVPCSRCLEPTAVSVREDLSVLAVPSPSARGGRGPRATRAGDDESSLDEADVIPYDGDTVVLDDLVRDELLLAIPMIPLCSQGCTGISPRPDEGAPGAGIDPRLAPLLGAKNKA